ncbi:TetR family transcriptional regulator [Brevibacterium marinum]|uniref:AcrR family transcriptional regulator n=1 Tax=Brevibacterium marinum TaxID=418643 RepID=A0A846RYB6_9MICO|nr:AcrR family transcriptional regulator [Brevibacterium marinum]
MTPRPHYSTEEVTARRGAILESTLDQIAQRGPESLRMKDVAAAAGVSVGTLQYYFGSREDLIVQAFSAHSRSVVEAIAGLSQTHGSAWEKLRSSLHAVPTIGDYRRRSQVWVELVAVSSRNDFLRASVDEVFDGWKSHFRALLDTGIRDGSFRPAAEADLIVDSLIAAIDGFDIVAVAGRAPASSDRIAESLVLTAAALLGVSSERPRARESAR